jgi:hypothetical protein
MKITLAADQVTAEFLIDGAQILLEAEKAKLNELAQQARSEIQGAEEPMKRSLRISWECVLSNARQGVSDAEEMLEFVLRNAEAAPIATAWKMGVSIIF